MWTITLARLDWEQSSAPFFLIAIIFIAIAVLFGYLEGVTTGWTGLIRNFPDTAGPYPYQWRTQGIGLDNWARYDIVKIGADKAGLHIGGGLLHRVGHPPLFIPWSEIQVVPGEHRGILKRRTLILGRNESVRIRISVSLAERLSKAAGQFWPGDTFWS
jgi:hypothetical protein